MALKVHSARRMVWSDKMVSAERFEATRARQISTARHLVVARGRLAAADGVVATAGDGGETFVAVGSQRFGEFRGVECQAGVEVSAVREEGFRGGGVLGKCFGAAEDGEGV